LPRRLAMRASERGAGAYAELVVGVREVVLDRLDAQHEPRGDIPVGQAFGDEIGNGALLRAERSERRGGRPRSRGRRGALAASLRNAETDTSPFSMENGAAILGAHFDHVETHLFTSANHYASEQALVDAYATTGRCRLIAEALGQSAVLDLATAAASGWFDNCPDGLWGEVRMAAFVCTGARTTLTCSAAP
jgi:hypothetical protein